jgi:hypothetical protein
MLEDLLFNVVFGLALIALQFLIFKRFPDFLFFVCDLFFFLLTSFLEACKLQQSFGFALFCLEGFAQSVRDRALVEGLVSLYCHFYLVSNSN